VDHVEAVKQSEETLGNRPILSPHFFSPREAFSGPEVPNADYKLISQPYFPQ
jgi:hypothetical protein